ncbi:acetyltransferase [Pseudomonas piscis]|uniref:acetyltransferase n=1 Tax=Pseudomonas TaxID=286 RepID=UPI000A1F1C70|nr:MULTISPECIES: acetyltransferase [unclassified Pseudomonas]
MTRHIVMGEGWAFEHACQIATELELPHVQHCLTSADRYNFQLDDFIGQYPAEDFEVFVALDERAVNYSRHKLIAQVRLAGYRLFNLVSPQAIIDDSAVLQGSVYIGAGCNLAAGSVLGLGCWLDRQVILDCSVKLGACVTLLAGVTLGRGAEVGKGTTLGVGSLALAGTKIGRHCEWLLGGKLPEVLPDKSFYDALMPDGARILKN